MAARKLELFAVQMRISAADYASADTFVHRLTGLFEQMDARRVRDRRGGYRYPALAVFPQDVGTFLLISRYYRLIRSAGTVERALRRIALLRLPRVFWISARHRAGVLRSLILMTGGRSYELYHRTFSYLARRHEMAVVAGSLLAPDNRYGATGTFRLRRRSPGVYNLSVTFDARGEVLHTARAVSGFPGLAEALGADEAELEAPHPFEVQGIRVGNAVSLNGWRPAQGQPGGTVGAHLVGAGAEILVRPVATTAPWSSKGGENSGEGEARSGEHRFGLGLLKVMASHPGVRFAVNAMLNGSFLDKRFEGRSAILGRDRAGAPVMLCEATSHGDTPESEQILYHLAVLPPRPRLTRPSSHGSP